MRSRKHWNRMLAVISCKILRDGHHAAELDRMVGMLDDPGFRRLVEDQGDRRHLPQDPVLPDPESAHPHQFDIRLMEKAVQDPETGALFATSEPTARLIV